MKRLRAEVEELQRLNIALAERVAAQSELLSKRAEKQDPHWPPGRTKEDAVTGDQKYLELLDGLRDLHIKKAADYGDGVDPLANLRESVHLGIQPWIGCMLRCSDKMQRVRSMIRSGSLANESIEDNLQDMAAYCLLALRLYRET